MFPGFPSGTVRFFEELRANNRRDWFEAEKPRYEADVLEPARAFVPALGERLLHLAPRLRADPRVNRSLFRLQRDTRFSPDKTPYKTNLGLWLWEGEGPRMACSGFYLHLEPPTLMLGVGLYQFPDPLLAAYREDVLDGPRGEALAAAAAAVTGAGPYTLGGRRWKRVPRGFDGAHPRADWLTFGGLYASFEAPIPPELHQPGFEIWCYEHYAKMLPVHAWLRELTARGR